MSEIIRILTVTALLLAAARAEAQITIEIRDYVEMPVTGKTDSRGNTDSMLARVNGLHEEPGGANRLFVHDQNGPLYILDKQTKKLTAYLDFNGRSGNPGIFHKLYFEAGYASGLAVFYFDPDYRRNGKFYTVHIEDPAIAGSNLPDNRSVPGLNISGYAATAPIKTPGSVQYEGVLIEWTDTNIANEAFEGTAREILRVQLNTRIHPLGDMIFNPTARPGDPEWRVLYIACGDGGSGESTTGNMRSNPQRLDNLAGKILRIIPDLGEHVASSTVSDNARYRIPNDNPFVSKEGARKEIWAYGLRNPHRLTWAVDPANAANNRLIANTVGLHTWEMVDIVQKGGNYGYSLREGNEQLNADNRTSSRPVVDRIPVRVNEPADDLVTPLYPVVQYGHIPGGGDAIGSGFLYNGAIAALRGKYLFTDFSTGRVWYVEFKDMLAADDGSPDTLAPLHEVKVLWNGHVYDTLFPIVETAYHARGGKAAHLPGSATVSTQGRADARFAVDTAGELYLYSKSDGAIRAVVGAVTSR